MPVCARAELSYSIPGSSGRKVPAQSPDHELGSMCKPIVCIPFHKLVGSMLGRVYSNRSSEGAMWAAPCEPMPVFYRVLSNTGARYDFVWTSGHVT